MATEAEQAAEAAALAKKEDDPGFKEVIAQRDQLKGTLRSQAEELTALRNFKAEQDKLAKDAADKKAIEAGNYTKIIEDNKKAAEAKETALISRMAVTAIPLIIKTAAAKITNLAPGALEDLPDLLDKHLALDAETFTVKVINADGTPMLDSKTGRAVDPTVYVENFIKDRPHMLTDALPVRHGLTPSSGKTSKASLMDLTDEEFDAAAKDNPMAMVKQLQAEFSQNNIVKNARTILADRGIMAPRRN